MDRSDCLGPDPVASGIGEWRGGIGSGSGEWQQRVKRRRINAASVKVVTFLWCEIRVMRNANHKVKGMGYQARPIHLDR